MSEFTSLIPGLPDDISLDCIARIPHRHLPSLRPVCRRWRDLLSSPTFLLLREKIGASENLVFLTQSLSPSPAPESKNSRPACTLALYNATDNSWRRVLSPGPIPLFAQCVAAGSKLFVLGGWDPETLDPSPEIRILDLVSGGWAKGKPMPAARSFFACAAGDGGKKVYVAGGHDAMKNALRSAAVYDAVQDEWYPMPEMGEERDEGRGAVIGGRFWAVSGYGTEGQGRFKATGERYEEEKGEWVREEGEEGIGGCFFGGELGMWSVGRRGVREWGKGGVFKRVKGEEVRGKCCAAAGIGKDEIFVMGEVAGEGGGAAGEVAGELAGKYGGWVVEMGEGRWRRVDTPGEFGGFAYSAAGVRI